MKVIGELIGGLLVAGILLGPAFGLYFVSKATLASLSYEGTEVAKIIDCESVRLPGPKARYRRVPVAALESGKRVRGTVDEVPFFWNCEDQIGKPVEVKFDPNNGNNAKLNTFLEMWFLPLVFTILCIVVYSAMGIGYLKKYRRVKES